MKKRDENFGNQYFSHTVFSVKFQKIKLQCSFKTKGLVLLTTQMLHISALLWNYFWTAHTVVCLKVDFLAFTVSR